MRRTGHVESMWYATKSIKFWLKKVKGKTAREKCRSRWKYNRTDPKETGVKCRYG